MKTSRVQIKHALFSASTIAVRVATIFIRSTARSFLCSVCRRSKKPTPHYRLAADPSLCAFAATMLISASNPGGSVELHLPA